jgi:superfamily II DNA or RNA helicase
LLRKVVNDDASRAERVLVIFRTHPKLIIFYNFTYELERLRELFNGLGGVDIGEWNGQVHSQVPSSERWVYLVQYTAGAEGWNCITTDTIIFYSQNYSYRTTHQAEGRIDRANTPFVDLYYYYLKSKAPIDLAIGRALKNKKNFNEKRYVSDKRRC